MPYMKSLKIPKPLVINSRNTKDGSGNSQNEKVQTDNSRHKATQKTTD